MDAASTKRPNQLRENILTAAIEAFSARGYDAVSTRAIAEAAGIEQGHLVYYFRNKESLWQEPFSRFKSGFEQVLSGFPDDKMEPDEILARAPEMFATIIRFFDQDRLMSRLLLREFCTESSREAWLVEELARPFWVGMKPLFTVLADRYSQPIHPVILFRSFLGSVLLYFGTTPKLEEMFEIDLQAENCLDEFIAYQIGVMTGQP